MFGGWRCLENNILIVVSVLGGWIFLTKCLEYLDNYILIVVSLLGVWMFLTKCLEYLENNIHIVVSLLGCLEAGGVSPKPISG